MVDLRDISNDVKNNRGKLVVRMSTGYSYNNSDGLLSQYKRIRIFKSKSIGGIVECFKEDCQNVGPDEVFHKITNINDVYDGVYEVILINEHRDWETGYVEDWDYKLIDYIE